MNERHIVGLIYERAGRSNRQFDVPMHMQVTQLPRRGHISAVPIGSRAVERGEARRKGASSCLDVDGHQRGVSELITAPFNARGEERRCRMQRGSSNQAPLLQ